MFGSIGGPEILLIFVLGLLLFGPRKLPEIGRTIGKTLGEFRRATNEFTASLEREVALEQRKDDKGDDTNPAGRLLAPAAGPVARGSRPAEAIAPAVTPVAPPSESQPPRDV